MKNKSLTYLSSLQDALHQVMDDRQEIILLGEDLRDPYGGAFKVTQGLSTKYPQRVFNTPISESSIVGISTGLSMRGFLPVAEIMFGDFLTLGIDQILNSASKFGLMYKNKIQVPIVIRTPMGGGKGYGPTHSQSIEKMFFGIPGLKVVSPSLAHLPGELLAHCIINEINPVLFIEYKNLYNKRLYLDNDKLKFRTNQNDTNFPIIIVDNSYTKTPDIIIITYGGMTDEVFKVMEQLVDEEINIRAIVPSFINSNLPVDVVEEFIIGCENILIIEMGTEFFNWGSEIAASLYEMASPSLKKNIKRLASKNTVVPSAKDLEEDVLVGYHHIEKAIFEVLT